MCFYIYY
jgi:hypothetical protein